MKKLLNDVNNFLKLNREYNYLVKLIQKFNNIKLSHFEINKILTTYPDNIIETIKNLESNGVTIVLNLKLLTSQLAQKFISPFINYESYGCLKKNHLKFHSRVVKVTEI